MLAILVAFALLVANRGSTPEASLRGRLPIASAANASAVAPVATRALVVRGTVTDAASAQPLAGATVVVGASHAPQTYGSATTARDGSYVVRITIADTATSIAVRAHYLGYASVQRYAHAAGDTATMNFALALDTLSRPRGVAIAAEKALRVGEGGSATSANATIDALGGHGYAAAQASIGPASRTYPSVAGMPSAPNRAFNTEEYSRIDDNRFLSVASAPLSTFSVDVDRASYTNVRRFINSGTLPPKDAVRIEELVNYFPYDYAEPPSTGRDPISITTDVGVAPWNPRHRIVRIGLQTQRIRTAKLPPSNLVFLIDVSGSMDEPNKLPLVKQAFRLLVNELREQDRVAIVVYAGNAGLVLPSTAASHKEQILDAIERLEAGGSTAGGAGIQLAYDVAKQNFIANGNNRVILATDGDFNVGVSSTSELDRLIEDRRKEGTYLTVLGFGMGNYKDSRLESLADKGNGNYAYIDDLMEARKVFVQEFGATLVTVAKDVKLQIEFNPAMVQAYRLIGYENRLLANEDFTNDARDAGDMGAGHSVTALYDVIPVGTRLDVTVGTTSAMRYQQPSTARPALSKELLFVNVRYKPPTDSVSRLMQHPVFDSASEQPDDSRFAIAVAGYGMLLRDSEFKGRMTYDDVLALAKQSAGDDTYRNDFITLVESTKRLVSGVALAHPASAPQ